MLKKQSESSVLIVGAVKDISATLEKDLNRLDRAFINFKQVSYFLVESNSSDNSDQTLEKIRSKRSDFDFELLHDAEPVTYSRTEKLSKARNRYLEYLDELSSSQKPDYVAVYDFNDLNHKLSLESIQSCWEKSDWDVCTANQNGHYYDIWALRHEYWSPNDCWKQFNFFLDLGVRKDKAYASSINSRMVRIPKDSAWIEVDSAFGGMAIYRAETLKSARYVGSTDSGEMICEHVALHSNIRAQGFKIFINPNFINFAYTDHSKNARIWNRFARFSKNLALSKIRK